MDIGGPAVDGSVDPSPTRPPRTLPLSLLATRWAADPPRPRQAGHGRRPPAQASFHSSRHGGSAPSLSPRRTFAAALAIRLHQSALEPNASDTLTSARHASPRSRTASSPPPASSGTAASSDWTVMSISPARLDSGSTGAVPSPPHLCTRPRPLWLPMEDADHG